MPGGGPLRKVYPMGLMRASVFGHSRMRILNPIPSEGLDRIVEALSLPPAPEMLDAGCGKAELLIRLVERHGGRGVGVDISPEFIDEARKNAEGRVRDGSLDLRVADLSAMKSPVSQFDLIARVGAPWVDTFEGTIGWMTRGLRSDGYAIVGEGYWRRRPTSRYLAALGASEDEMTTLSGLQEAVRRNGLEVLDVVDATTADWERYEQGWRDGILDFVRDHPDDPDGQELAQRAEQGWHRFDVLGGREMLGFALILAWKAT